MANMNKNSTARIIVLSTLAGLTVMFLGAAVISFQNATEAHENSRIMKMTRNHETRPSTMTEVILPMPTHVSTQVNTGWEQTQAEVQQLRSQFVNGSQGYQQLSHALQESGPTDTWCQNLQNAIQEYQALNKTTSAKTTQTLTETHDCP